MDRPADAAPLSSQADVAPSLPRGNATPLPTPADFENERQSRKEHGSRRSKSNRAPGEKPRRTGERRRRDSQGSTGMPAPQPLGSEVTSDEFGKDRIESTQSTETTATIKANDVTIDDEAVENDHRSSNRRDARNKVLRERHSTLKVPPAPAPADALVPPARLLPETVPVSATARVLASEPVDEQGLDEYETVRVSEQSRQVNRADHEDLIDLIDEKSIDEGLESPPEIPMGEHTWEELEAIEKRRRAILLRGEHDVWRTLCCVDGTVMKFLLEDSLFWITVILYITTRLLARYSQIPAFVAGLGDGNLTTIGGFITFFLALYVNNSHARYFDQYDAAMACKGRILDVASLATTYLPKATTHRLVRYMNAAHVAGYVGLSSTYSYSNFFVKLNKDFGLLTAVELERMNTIDLDKGGSCNRELIVWCLREIQACHAQGIIDHELSREFRDHILRLRAALGTIYDAADLPIPFFYVHFISLLTALYLPLFAVSAAYKVGIGTEVFWFGDILVLLVVVLQAIFVNGLRLLGQKMNDPFGDDLTDLSVIFYVTFTWTMSNRILESGFVDTSETDEYRLRKRQISLGEAWETRKEKV